MLQLCALVTPFKILLCFAKFLFMHFPSFLVFFSFIVGCYALNAPDSFWEHQNHYAGDQNLPRTQVCRGAENDCVGIHLEA